MYLSYFGLNEKPFNITPDPRFLYMSVQHRDALAHLLYSTDESSSFIVLSGEVGTGKTTLCRSMLEEGVEGSHFALVLNPMQTPMELLASVCDEFHIDYPDQPGIKRLVDALNRWLLEKNAAGEQAILVIDEAQNLNFETLEQIRLLTNLETGQKKLLKIILIGQPELRTLLARPELRQLSQRVTARYHLEPMSRDETGAYLQHRLGVAGCRRALFTPAAVRRLHHHAGGIPRRINLIADRALTGAYALQQEKVERKLVDRAAAEVRGATTHYRRWLAAAAFGFLMLIGALFWWQDSAHSPHTMAQPNLGTVILATAANGTEVTRKPLADDYVAALMDTPDSTPVIAAPEVASSRPTPVEQLFAEQNLRLDLSAGIPACEQARQQGAQCLSINGKPTDLSKLGRSALIEDANESGQARRLLVTPREDGTYAVSTRQSDEIWTAEQLQKHWPGQFLLLWRPPPSGRHRIDASSGPADFDWLRSRLQRAGIDTRGAMDILSLREPIREYQQRAGLNADGIAGIRTLLQLERRQSRPQPTESNHVIDP